LLRHQEPIGQHYQAGVVMKPTPRTALEMIRVQPVWLQISRRRKPLKSGEKAVLPEIGPRRPGRRGAIIPSGGLRDDAQGTYPDR
jgi:hypothetical protein